MIENIFDLLGRAVSILSIVLMVVGFIMLIRQINKSNRLRASSLLLSMVFSILMLMFNAFVLRSTGIRWWYVFLLIFGIGFGLAWGKTTKLDIRENKVLGKRSIGYILFWLISLLLTQVLALFAKRDVVAFGLVGMFFSTGISMGTNSNILLRIRKIIRFPESFPAAKPNSSEINALGIEKPQNRKRKRKWLIAGSIIGSVFVLAIAAGLIILFLLSSQDFSFDLSGDDPIDIPSETQAVQPIEENLESGSTIIEGENSDKTISEEVNSQQLSPEEIANDGISQYEAYLYINGEFAEEFTTSIEISFTDGGVCLTENGEKTCLSKAGLNEYLTENGTSRIVFTLDGFIWHFLDQESEVKVFFILME